MMQVIWEEPGCPPVQFSRIVARSAGSPEGETVGLELRLELRYLERFVLSECEWWIDQA